MTKSTPSMSSSGNIRPASTRTMSSPYSMTVMLRPPISSTPPRGIIESVFSIGITLLSPSYQELKQGLLAVEPVFRLVEYNAPRAVHHAVRYLLPSLRGQAVHYYGVILGAREQRLVNLIPREPSLFLLGLFFL